MCELNNFDLYIYMYMNMVYLNINVMMIIRNDVH